MAELTQEQIDSMFNSGAKPENDNNVKDAYSLTEVEKDTIGEIGNISMGNAATALSKLLNRGIKITTPKVSVVELHNMDDEYSRPYVAVEIEYTQGLKGKNILHIQTDDVKIITDIMMGGPGNITEGDISEMHLSAMGELMNQMTGSSATALAKMFNKRIDISPPKPFIVKVAPDDIAEALDGEEHLVKTVFTLSIEDKGDSEVMILLPFQFAREMIDTLTNQFSGKGASVQKENVDTSIPAALDPPAGASIGSGGPGEAETETGHKPLKPKDSKAERHEPVEIKKIQFQTFGEDRNSGEMDESKYDILMDIPLQVSVELGRTRKSINEILGFKTGTIIELNRLAGEAIDIVINNKVIGKGEVIVIDESYGVKITEVTNSK